MSKLHRLLLNHPIQYLLVILFLVVHPKIALASVVINEVLPHPSSGNDWIELYKTDPNEVDMSSWKLEDTTGVMETFAASTKFASGSSFMQVFVSNRLNNDGDTIRMKDKDGIVIDEKGYTQDPGVNVSFGRYPDGTNSWDTLLTTSPNGSNSDFAPSPTPTPIPTSVPDPTATPKPIDTPVPTLTPKPQNTPTTKPLPTPTKIPTRIPKPTTTVIPEVESQEESPTGLVLGEETKTANKPSLLLLILLLGGGSSLLVAAVILSYRESRRRHKIY